MVQFDTTLTQSPTRHLHSQYVKLALNLYWSGSCVLIGYLIGQIGVILSARDFLGILCCGPARKKIPFWPLNKSFSDQACSVEMAGYRRRSFLLLANTQPNLLPRSLVDEASSTRDQGRRLYPCACRISHDMNPDIFAGLTIRSWESVETRFRCIKRWRLLKTRLWSHLLTR